MASTTRRPISTPFRLGLVAALVALVVGAALFAKNQILTMVTPGESMAAEFGDQYRLKEYVTKVKVAGVPVGVVTGVDRTEQGTALVEFKVDHGIRGKLGTAPSALIAPTTLLGGNYYVELVPGGAPGESEAVIPRERTEVPVELDKVAAALQPDALTGLQSSTRNLDGVLAGGGSEALQDLARTAPGTLGPAGGVLAAARGTRPDTDLTELVRGLESTSQALAENQGQLDDVVTGLDSLSGVLDRRGGDIAAALADLPPTLRATDTGLQRLDGTLAELRDTADVAVPVVEELDGLLERVDPVLAEARPVVGDLRSLLTDARPLVGTLSPVSQDLTAVFDNLHGPVLDRVNGPILETVNSPYQGSGPYAGSGGDRPLYQELGHMAANVDNTAAMTESNGAVIGFNPGVNGGTVAGLPAGVSLEQMFANLARFQEIQR
ncbi:MlaD family protein [Pseudonocardia bannensis]|uniref:MCE family protein n=1 Tax=Pseudonocardia bannensis TaxID=630973 RepID=A0A848DBM1_9PSEU|nr:MlaD family protein [Pseudonocardia bannensis]NMH90240.1 MCE family protein [Pseudonocardia bannensis]